MEREFSGVDENDPRAMGRMMRRMAEPHGREDRTGRWRRWSASSREAPTPTRSAEQLGGDAPTPARGGPRGPVRRSPARRAGGARPRATPKLYDYP